MLNKLEMLRIFKTAAEAGSFKGAAIKLGISPQAVTRAVKELERLQDEVLFHRNTRQIQLTSFGESFLSTVVPVVSQVDQLFLSHSDHAGDALAGNVRVAAPLGFGRAIVAPVLINLLKRYPKINVDLRLSDKYADVVEERIDIGLRIGFVRDNRYIVRKLGKVDFHVVAAPELIKKVGEPNRPEDLAKLPTSSVLDASTGRTWPWYFSQGSELKMPESRMIFDDAQAEYKAVKEGLVFAQVPSFLCTEDVQNKHIKKVLKEFEPEPWTLYIYRPQRGPVPHRVRTLFDDLSAEIMAILAQ
ncbi:LysR family transcriptional regulator [Aliiglaciecola sp. LCG003]|uniref:LysR family transcriptional regulator n=1 Tax=Aliiglaciecola sp. LCG003 TaxID=3053655 RepID=UPI002574315C|nr:LysR family transcriptional regulator [Aliiglaciecola sp. LCG003]WJG07835.1 LysR family transcriptional regulator [Aliiglaciecola sp. LCG003]